MSEKPLGYELEDEAERRRLEIRHVTWEPAGKLDPILEREGPDGPLDSEGIIKRARATAAARRNSAP